MTKQLKQRIVAHAAAIALAAVTSLIVAAPQIYFRIEHKNDGVYQGIEMLPDSPWTARVREVQDGHPNFGNIYGKDGKNDPYLFQPLGSMMVAYMGTAFSLDINNTILLSRLVLPFITFLLVYGFVFLLCKKRLVALAVASVLLLGEAALTSYGLLALVQGMSPADFIRIARPVNPVMIYIFFFGFLAAFYRFYRNRDWRWGALSAVLLGANFYNYFYSWTFLYAFGGILGFILLLRTQWRDAWSVAIVYVGATVLAIPYILNLYRASQFPSYEEVGARLGILYTHEPLFVGFTVLIALAAFLLWYPRQDTSKYFFGLALLLAPFITMNQQLLTGRIMQADHYHWFFHKPLGVLFMLLTMFYLIERSKFVSYKKALTVCIIVVSFGIGAFMQADSYTHEYQEGGAIAVERQKYGPVMQWLNGNAEKEAVIFSSDFVSHLTVIYTPQNVLYHRALCCTTLWATNERVLDILFLFYRLRDVDAASTLQTFTKESRNVSAQIYGIYYRKLMGEYEAIPEEKIEEIAALYKETLKTPASQWLKETLKKYEVEYLVWDRKAEPLWNLDPYPFIERAVEFDDIVIYRVNYGI